MQSPYLRRGLFCALTVLVLLPAAQAPAAQQKVAILLEDESSRDHDRRVLQAMTDAFLESRRFQIIERSQVERILREQNFQSFIGDEGQRLGRLVGADYLALVSYSTREKEGVTVYTLRSRIVSVTTGQVTATLDSQGGMLDRFVGSPTIEAAGEEIRQAVMSKFPIEGVVARVDGDEVVVALGRGSGIEKGHRLLVIRTGDPIPHPTEPGKFIPGEEREVGTLKVLTVNETTALCKLRKDLEGVQPGDLARFNGKGGIGGVF